MLSTLILDSEVAAKTASVQASPRHLWFPCFRHHLHYKLQYMSSVIRVLVGYTVQPRTVLVSDLSPLTEHPICSVCSKDADRHTVTNYYFLLRILPCLDEAQPVQTPEITTRYKAQLDTGPSVECDRADSAKKAVVNADHMGLDLNEATEYGVTPKTAIRDFIKQNKHIQPGLDCILASWIS